VQKKEQAIVLTILFYFYFIKFNQLNLRKILRSKKIQCKKTPKPVDKSVKKVTTID